MMRRKISFCLISNCGAPVRQFSASKTVLQIIGCICIAAIFALAYLAYDYYALSRNVFSNEVLEATISQQQQEIGSQRKQIQTFAEDINRLKIRLANLKASEKKLRVIANLEPTKEQQEGLFGIGGSLPEDLDTKIDITEKHNSLVRDMHEQVEELNAAISSQGNVFSRLLKHLEDQQSLLACTPSIKPTDGWITSKFGHRKSPFTGKREFHKGLDIATRKKSSIFATANGVVTFVGRKGYLGNVIIIDHGYGIVTRYAHLYKALKKKGEKVRRGDKIALVGSTGRTTGPHLHYEVRLNGVPVNPEKYILE
jgi:murein DD-endopeptidase MepM/ murein hydrolase activator NlpD